MQNLADYKGKLFRHFKGGLYLLVDLATHTETRETLVLYKALYGDGELYARPYEMFIERVPVGKANPTGQEYRFEHIESENMEEMEQ